MGTIKKLIFSLSIVFLSTVQSCKNEDSNSKNISLRNESILLADTIDLSENLKKSSFDFIKKFNYSNRLIEVNIDKKEPNEIIISYSCRGIADFEIKKFKPLFSYKLRENLFFVYTGAEELLNISFDTSKYVNYNFDICTEPKKATYIYHDNQLQLDTIGLYPEPFSSLPPPMPPPTINNKTPKFTPNQH